MPSYSGVWTLPAQMQARAAGNWTVPPDAPTSVVATGGDAQASVAFTAPTYTGNPAGVTGYTVTSSPGGLTGTGASSPIIVTGLTNATAYTFTVTATGASGVSAPSAASNSVTPAAPPVVGDAFGGGFYAGEISTAGDGVADYYLVVGPLSTAQSREQWKTTQTNSPGTTSTIDGPANSAAMNDASHPAAQFCEGLTIGGYSDWYMPSKYELEICYYNLKPSTTSNNTAAGLNPYSVPTRLFNYYTGTPPQTPVAAFRETTGTEQFTSADYWSSTQNDQYGSWYQSFIQGTQGAGSKASSELVRAVRRVPV